MSNTHELFDAQLQAVTADDDYGPDLVIVEGQWTDTRTGRIGPAALALDPADVTFGDDDKGYVLGSVLRAAVAEIAAEEGFKPVDKNIEIRIGGCPHSFNTAGEIIAHPAGDTPVVAQ